MEVDFMLDEDDIEVE